MSDQYRSRSKMSAEDYARYNDTRRGRYPKTHADEYPSAEAERDYKEYKELTEDANQSMKQYWKGYEKHAGSRKTQIETLTQRQHSSMLLPAAEAATDTLAHARSRDSFLEEHPYAYHNAQERYKHEGHATKAYADASRFRDRYATHQSGSTKSSPPSFAPLGAKEPYWQLDRITRRYCHIERDGTVIWEDSKEHSASVAARLR